MERRIDEFGIAKLHTVKILIDWNFNITDPPLIYLNRNGEDHPQS